MADYDQVQQDQIDQVKYWLKAYGMSVLIGVSTAMAGIAGYKYWDEGQSVHHQEASIVAQGVVSQLGTSNFGEDLSEEAFNELLNKGVELETGYADTAYAAYGAIAIARGAYQRGDSDLAVKHLQWAVDNSKYDDVTAVAKLRLAKILAELDRNEEALKLVESPYPLYSLEYQETKGDILTDMGDIEAAKAAYSEAIALSASYELDRPSLQWKRDALNSAPDTVSVGETAE